jgi:hypothetical protein
MDRVPIRFRLNDADPTESRSTTLFKSQAHGFAGWLQRELWNGDDVSVHAHTQVLRGAHRHLLSHLG